MDRSAVTFETCAPGPSLLVSSSRRLTTDRGRLADLELTIEWLVAFNRDCQTQAVRWSEAERADASARAAMFVKTFGINPWRERLARSIERRAGDLEGLTLPQVLQHNDLGPWNVHREGSRLTVIDWEVNGGDPEARRGLPMTDAVYFATHWLFAARRLRDSRQQLGAFRELVTGAGRDRLTCAARSALAAYSDALAIDRRFIPLLVALTWIDRGNDRACRARGEASPNGDAAAASYCRYVDQMGAEADALFLQGFHG
jgi:hypothetical protein